VERGSVRLSCGDCVVKAERKFYSSLILDFPAHSDDTVNMVSDRTSLIVGEACVQNNTLHLSGKKFEETCDRSARDQVASAVIVLEYQSLLAAPVSAEVDDGRAVLEQGAPNVSWSNRPVLTDGEALSVTAKESGLDLTNFLVKA
jgi:hypothetical protein